MLFNYLGFILLLIAVFLPVGAQPRWDAQAFWQLSPEARYRYVHDFPFWKIKDQQQIRAIQAEMLAIARASNDHHSAIATQYYMCFSEEPAKVSALLHTMKSEAESHDYVVEAVVASHYLQNHLGSEEPNSYEKEYVSFQKTLDKINEIGIEKFSDYNGEGILLQAAQFMWELEDYEKAFIYLTQAEKLIRPTEEGMHFYNQVMSYLQSYWKQRGEIEKSIGYAKKMLYENEKFYSSDKHLMWVSRFWQGLSSIEIASLLMAEGKPAEGEQYARKGYELSRAADTVRDFVVPYQAEFDALLVLIPAKLNMGKWDEAGELLQRGLHIQQALEPLGQMTYFKPLQFYEYLSQYHEKRGDMAAAFRYLHKAHTLQDSLNSRNDVRRLAQAQRRFDAERYARQIELIEDEKQIQKIILYSIFLILMLVIMLAYTNFRHQREKHALKEAELADTRSKLVYLTHSFREKSDMVENLRKEKEMLDVQGAHNVYLEQLTRATILTEDDWVQFRAVFEKVYPGFITQQKKLYTGITPAEIRLLVLDKLGLSVPEIANMLGVNKNTVYQTRARLRRKTGEDA